MPFARSKILRTARRPMKSGLSTAALPTLYCTRRHKRANPEPHYNLGTLLGMRLLNLNLPLVASVRVYLSRKADMILNDLTLG